MTATPMPWPDVPECYTGAPSLIAAGHSCRQCDGSHAHRWATWTPPAGHPLSFGPGLPSRCVDCGGRKCDMTECWERRHHHGPHVNIDGQVLRMVGA